jgi:CRISPR type III-A-associated RAMP protein Csm4
MARLGLLDEWLDATARAAFPPLVPAVRFSSCFPFNGDTLYVTPPRSLWPPLASSKVRWKGARFAPLHLVQSMLTGKSVSEEGWAVDGASEALITMGTQGPFRVAVRSSAAVDRGGAAVEPHSSACLEFAPHAGLWMVAEFADDNAHDKWKGNVTAALRLLADSGFGGERSRGWGRADIEFSDKSPLARVSVESSHETAWWLLSMYHPSPTDPVDWKRGNYAIATRTGRAEGADGSGEASSGALNNRTKRATRMITEGSVLVAAFEPKGSVTDVAPDGFPHPVYRAGYAIAIPIPMRPPVARELPKALVEELPREAVPEAAPELPPEEPPAVAEELEPELVGVP